MKYIVRLLVFGLLLISLKASAQLNPLLSQYFNNRYLSTPAYAGIDSGLNLNMSYRKQWSNIPGSPQVQNLTADYGMGRVGLGLNVNLDKAGLQRQNRIVGSYAYHLVIDSGSSKLSFGLSLGFMNQQLSQSDINGNPSDPIVAQYNDRETYIDGDFGLAYSLNGLKLEAALPNLNFLFKRSLIKMSDVPMFYTAASYVIPVAGGQALVETKAAYRGVTGFDNIIDLGANISLISRQLMLMGMYHSSKSLSLGLGLDYKRRYLVTGVYTTQTSALNSYSNGSFEFSLRLRIGRIN
ncbi:MAG: type IX secretion system membrane protein PorP/SprF [Bacteroidota bacterium]